MRQLKKIGKHKNGYLGHRITMSIIYLDKEDILLSHQLSMAKFGGEFERIDHSCVEKRVVEPQTNYYGEEQYPGFLKKQLYTGIV